MKDGRCLFLSLFLSLLYPLSNFLAAFVADPLVEFFAVCLCSLLAAFVASFPDAHIALLLHDITLPTLPASLDYYI